MRVSAYDSAYPTHRAIADVYVTVVRNPNAPVFDQNPYRKSIPDGHTVGKSFIHVKNYFRLYFCQKHNNKCCMFPEYMYWQDCLFHGVPLSADTQF